MISTGTRIGQKTGTYVGRDERIRCLRDQIVVRPEKPKWSALIEVATTQNLRGTVIAVGPGCYPNIHQRGKKDGKDYHTVRKSEVFRPTALKIGDVVELGSITEEDGRLLEYMFPTIMVETEEGLTEHLVCREEDVAAVHCG
jgi:co-chaperonin GroES (HSP10)